MQQSVTVTAVKLSSQTGVTTAPRATCKRAYRQTVILLCLPHFQIISIFSIVFFFLICPLFSYYLAVCGRCVLKMDHHCPWYVRSKRCTLHKTPEWFEHIWFIKSFSCLRIWNLDPIFFPIVPPAIFEAGPAWMSYLLEQQKYSTAWFCCVLFSFSVFFFFFF